MSCLQIHLIGLDSTLISDLSGYGASIARLVTFVRLGTEGLGAKIPDIQSMLYYFHGLYSSDAKLSLVSDTQAVWFSMLETGLAIVALNMPSIWGLRTHAPVETFLRSMRSLISLNSITSRREQNSYNNGKWSLRTHKDFSHIDQDIELVPDTKRGQFSICSATTAGKWQNGDWSYRHTESDLEIGIAVRKSVDLQESRIE